MKPGDGRRRSRQKGREIEARFQWAHARDLKPEDEELPKIEEKLKTGLAPSAADANKPKKPDGG